MFHCFQDPVSCSVFDHMKIEKTVNTWFCRKTMVKLWVYLVCTGWQEPVFPFWAKHSRGQEGSRAWFLTMTLDFAQEPPLCGFGKPPQLCWFPQSRCHFVTPSGKTHRIRHIFMSLQSLNLLCKSPLRYHCISLIIDFEQRLTCNRRANCGLVFRDCSLTPSRGLRAHMVALAGGSSAAFPERSIPERSRAAARASLEWCERSPGQADDEQWDSSLQALPLTV